MKARKLLLFLAIAGVMAGATFVMFLQTTRGDFWWRRARYEAVVRAVGQALPAGKEARESLLLDEDGPAPTVRLLDYEKPADRVWLQREHWSRLVSGRRCADGRLTVTICTWNLGHAGVGGLFYSSGPPEPGEADHAFGMGTSRALGGGWWEVEDYSQ